MTTDDTASMFSSISNVILMMGLLPLVNKLLGVGNTGTSSGLLGICGNNTTNTVGNNNNSSNNPNTNSNNTTPPADIQFWQTLDNKMNEFMSNGDKVQFGIGNLFDSVHPLGDSIFGAWENNITPHEFKALQEIYSQGIGLYGVDSFNAYFGKYSGIWDNSMYGLVYDVQHGTM